MAKKVKFPLTMAKGAPVRTLEELREHFDLTSVLEYYTNGKLQTWLVDRYYENEAGKVAALDSSSADFKKQLCEILGVEYKDDAADSVDLGAIAERTNRLNSLRKFTADDAILAAVDNVAFSQEELGDLLDEDISPIYLCGEKFTIPVSKGNITYIGVNNPQVEASGDPADFATNGVVFKDVDKGWIEITPEELRKQELAQIRERSARLQMCISAGARHTVGLKADGTVVAVGDNDEGQCDIQDWQDIIAVFAGRNYTVGLKADGTVVVAGDNTYAQCDVQDWRDIIAVSAREYHTVGLKADGTVVAAGKNLHHRCDVQDWRGIIAVSSSDYHTVGMKADGTVVAVGGNDAGQCDIQDWRDIIAVSAVDNHTVGLKADGTVVAAGYNLCGQCDVQDWRDIIAISGGYLYTVGLKADGTVVAAGKSFHHQCDVQDWRDIIAISSYIHHTVGLKADGTVVIAGENDYGQCDVQDWRDIGVFSK